MRLTIYIAVLVSLFVLSCKQEKKVMQDKKHITAKNILGNPDYLGICYGGYRDTTRKVQPTIVELKEDIKILSAMGIKIIRTYNVQFAQAENILKAISEIRLEDSNFEMYVMLGAWIDCENAWTDAPNHAAEDVEANRNEIKRAVNLANTYPDIVKILAVGNEAMVHWAWSYWVEPGVIFKWVNHLQNLKKSGELPIDLWITSSDNFASWGGGDSSYHKEDLTKLMQAVDYISMHTYPMHDTHYHPVFWGIKETESNLSKEQQIESAMLRAKSYAIKQYKSVKKYMDSLGINKPIHIGETGWASFSGGQYGNNGSKATDEYKQALYYKHMREWAQESSMSCFFFEAFDEIWKDAENPKGSENHFGLFTLEGKAKYALWDLVDKEVFKDLRRNGNPITKTFNGDKLMLMESVLIPNAKTEIISN